MKKTTNKDVIQSYIFTTAKYDFSVTEKRIIYRQIEIEQALLNGIKLEKNVFIDTSLWGNKRYTIPIKLLLKDEDDKNYTQVRKAFESLLKKTLIVETPDFIEGFGIIQQFKIDKRSSFVSWVSHPIIVEASMNFAKGFRKYELETAMKFESVYSMRFYELMSEKNAPIKYTIENLKKMFGIEDKYKQINDFLRYVINPAKKELDAKSPYTFTFEPYKHGRKIVGFTFYPVYQPQYRDSELQKRELLKQVAPTPILTAEITKYLEDNFGFDRTGIKRNLELFRSAKDNIPNFIEWLGKKRRTANDANNPKGYIINAIKSELKQPQKTAQTKKINNLSQSLADRFNAK